MFLVPVAVLSLAYLFGTPATPVDLQADRLSALAAIDGADPYQPVNQLAGRYGSDLWWEWIHPRTPGALLLQVPLVVLGEASLRLVAVVGTAAALVLTAVYVMRHLGFSDKLLIPGAIVVGMLSISVEAATVGAQSSVLALLLAVAWIRLRLQDDVGAGVAVGVAITLKVFPWLLLIVLLWSRRRAAASALVTGAALFGVGLLFPGVSFGGAAIALSSANQSAALDLNASVTRFLVGGENFESVAIGLAVVGLLGALLVTRLDWDFDRKWFAVMALGLAVSPLIWSHYALVLVPGLIWMVSQGGRLKVVGAVLTAALVLPAPLVIAWYVVPALIVGMLIATAMPSRLAEPARP